MEIFLWINCFLFVFIPLQLDTWTTGFQLPYKQSRRTYNETKAICALSNVFLTDSTLFEICTSHHRELKTKTFWLNIKLVQLNYWATVEGHYYKTHLTPKLTRVLGQDCSIVRTADEFLDAISCSEKTEGYICELKDEYQCPGEAECLNVTSLHRFAIFRQNANWYKGLEACSSLGLDLAWMKAENEEKVLYDLRVQLTEQGHFTFGIVSSFWAVDPGNAPFEKIEPIKNFKWEQGEPMVGKACASTYYSEDKWLWQSSHCDEKHDFICGGDGFEVSCDSTDPTATDGDTTSRSQKILSSQGSSSSLGPSTQDNNLNTSLGDTKFWIVLILLVITWVAGGFVLVIPAVRKYRNLRKPRHKSASLTDEIELGHMVQPDHENNDLPDNHHNNSEQELNISVNGSSNTDLSSPGCLLDEVWENLETTDQVQEVNENGQQKRTG